jgi:argininosuccinate lyase
MPQKRNPDSLELVRGASAQQLGRLTAALATLKAMPAGYQKDFQENNATLFAALDSATAAADIMSGVVAGLELRADRTAAAIDASTLATDVADLLVRAGKPFREAHAAVGALVRRAEQLGVALDQVPPDAAAAADPLLPGILTQLGGAEASVERRNLPGGTGREAVLAKLAEAERVFDTRT